MDRTRKVVRTAALLGSLSALSSSASAQSGADLPDVRNIRPVVMLLVDTSGSMERKPVPTSGVGCGECKPACTGNELLDQHEKNRWAVTLEALTGHFDEFRCYERNRSTAPFVPTDFDYGYFLPHYDFFGAGVGETPSVQNQDGVLDSFLNVAKFGLMTFDGVGTTIGGDTLVPRTRWNDADFLAEANGAPGMYSYGWIRPLSFVGCVDRYGFNAGARGRAPVGQVVPGALIGVSASDDLADVTAVNAAIETSLRGVRPYGGTPIAAMMDDLQYYLNTDNAVNNVGDRYYNCRSRYAILLTDGAPDRLFRDDRFRCQETADESRCAGNDCECPYDTEEEIAANLVRTHTGTGEHEVGGLDRLFIVGYNVDDNSAISKLNDIARYGNTNSALLAADAAALTTHLRDVMDLAIPEASSRSVPVSVQTSVFGGNTYEITSGFRVGATSNEPWYGILNRRRLTCQNNNVVDDTTLAGDDLFHLQLNAQGARDIVTTPPATRQEARGTLYGDYTPQTFAGETVPSTVDFTGTRQAPGSRRNLNLPNISSLPNNAPTPDATATEATALGQALERTNVATVPFASGGPDGLSPALFSASATASDVAHIADYVLATSGNPARQAHKLGDIFHSNPVVVNPLAANEVRYLTSDTRYASWLSRLAGYYSSSNPAGRRPGAVYVGTNDGILHAFNLEDWSTPSNGTVDAGVEFWGYVPPALYNKMPAMVTPTHQWMFDGTPVVKDVVLHRPAGSVTGAFYRTVLLSAVRGAPAFIALDVTFPDQRPRFMWQRSFADLGNTTGTPALTQVNMQWASGGAPEQRAVAILPGGSGTLTGAGACNVQSGDMQALAPNNDARAQVRCWQQRGRSLYVVDVASGRLIQEFDSRHFPSPLSGAVAVDGVGTSVSRAAYFTDADGVLWRLSMVSPDPSDWLVAPIFDIFAGEAYNAGRGSSAAPVLTRDPLSNLVIAVGTGDLDNLTDTASHRVVSVTERRVVSASSSSEIADRDLGNGQGPAPNLNWLLPLREGESVTGPLALFENVLYFGTFESPTGTSGDACRLGVSRLYGANVRLADLPDNATLPKPELLDEGATSSPNDDTYSLYVDVDPTGSSLVLGPAITRQPVCTQGAGNNNATAGSTNFIPTGASSGGGYMLKALVGGGRGAVGTQVGGSQLREFKMPLRVVPQLSAVGFAGAVE